MDTDGNKKHSSVCNGIGSDFPSFYACLTPGDVQVIVLMQSLLKFKSFSSLASLPFYNPKMECKFIFLFCLWCSNRSVIIDAGNQRL